MRLPTPPAPSAVAGARRCRPPSSAARHRSSPASNPGSTSGQCRSPEPSQMSAVSNGRPWRVGYWWVALAVRMRSGPQRARPRESAPRRAQTGQPGDGGRPAGGTNTRYTPSTNDQVQRRKACRARSPSLHGERPLAAAVMGRDVAQVVRHQDGDGRRPITTRLHHAPVGARLHHNEYTEPHVGQRTKSECSPRAPSSIRRGPPDIRSAAADATPLATRTRTGWSKRQRQPAGAGESETEQRGGIQHHGEVMPHRSPPRRSRISAPPYPPARQHHANNASRSSRR